MVRNFETHKIRKSKELTACLWNFHTLQGEQKEHVIQVNVPSCWETYPDTLNYRGKASYSRTFEAQGNVRLERLRHYTFRMIISLTVGFQDLLCWSNYRIFI